MASVSHLFFVSFYFRNIFGTQEIRNKMPKVYILSETGNEELGESIKSLLEASIGPLNYLNKSIEKIESNHKVMTFEDLFVVCKDFRNATKSVNPVDFVVLLSPKPNIDNWFSAPDFENNIFVHTEGWEMYCRKEPKYPLAHEIMSNIVQSYLFEDLDELAAQSHTASVGCINDYCKKKEDVIKKLESGNVCEDCCDQIELYFADDPGNLYQINTTLISISNAFKRLATLVDRIRISKIEIQGEKDLKFTDYNNCELQLSAILKVVYILFLTYQDGLNYNEIPDMREEILNLYFKHVPSRRGRGRIETTIDILCKPLDDPDYSKSLKSTVSKINKALKKCLGEDKAEQYTIGQNPETLRHFIKLPPEFRVFKD